MMVRAQFLALLFVGLAGGFAVGAVFLAPQSRAPDDAPNVDLLGELIAAPVPVAATPSTADSDLLRAEQRRSPSDETAEVTAPADSDDGNSDDSNSEKTNSSDDSDDADEPPTTDDEDDAPLVPSTVHQRAVFDDDITLIPRGPGRYAVLDIRPVHRKKLSIHAGALERDGGASFSDFAKHRTVGYLRGPKARVELLHLGFDRDGVPTLAHIRPANRPLLEGIVSLRRGDRLVRVLPDRGAADADEPF